MNDPLLVTGGCGFIGSALVRRLVADGVPVVNLDKLTYAGHPSTVAEVADRPHYAFVHADVADAEAVEEVFRTYRPRAVVHLAAESHVDRSIDGPAAFVRTNVEGTHTLLEAARRHWRALPPTERAHFRFLHVSTDEVFGALGEEGAFTEATPYAPRSPYAATKAAADHLVRAWHHTYGLPTLVSNCSNNYGPFQYPEKLVPVAILKALAGEPIPVYGTGRNVRDWLHVDDHVRALRLILERGTPGETYLVGGRCERRTIDVVRAVCAALDALAPRLEGSYADLIAFVADRPGHDWRYAIDPSKLERALGWRATVPFEEGLRSTVAWYLAHRAWCEEVLAGRYALERLGTAA